MDKEIRKSVGAISQKVANTSVGHCSECGISWDFVKGKSIPYTEKSGFFIVCEHCWNNTGIKDLIKHCTKLHKEWEYFGGTENDPTLDRMINVVMNEYVKRLNPRKAGSETGYFSVSTKGLQSIMEGLQEKKK